MASMPTRAEPDPLPAVSPSDQASTPSPEPSRPHGPGVLTALICEACGNTELIRVKGCWYCEKCRHKFDCYGW